MLAPPIPALAVDLAPPIDPAARWSEAYQLWLASRRSPSTRRAYRKAWDSLISQAAKAPWEISRLDVLAWIEAQRLAGLAPETLHQRLAAVSSFYTYVARLCTLPGPNGSELPLHTYNPAAGVNRPRTSPYGKARYLSHLGLIQVRFLYHEKQTLELFTVLNAAFADPTPANVDRLSNTMRTYRSATLN